MITGEAIKTKRKALNWTADKLATHLGVKVSNLYKWEKGHLPSNPQDYMALEKWLGGHSEKTEKTVKTGTDSKLENVIKGSFQITAEEYIGELRDLNKKYQAIIDTNLTAIAKMLTSLSRHDQAYHETMLRSLARLENRNESDLVLEAGTKEVDRMD